jgi:hypothetical protein
MVFRRTGAVALLFCLVLIACSGQDQAELDAAGRADRLWSSRTPYVGDNARVLALLGEVGFGQQGTYTTSLQTEKPPYGLTVELRRLEKPFPDVDFRDSATLVLGLVANLDHIDITFGAQSFTLAAAEISGELGYDVKTLGQDRSRLAAYVQSGQD